MRTTGAGTGTGFEPSKEKKLQIQRFLKDMGPIFSSYSKEIGKGNVLEKEITEAIKNANQLTILIAQKVFNKTTLSVDEKKIFRNLSSHILSNYFHSSNKVNLENIAGIIANSLQLTDMDNIEDTDWSKVSQIQSLKMTSSALCSELISILIYNPTRYATSDLLDIFVKKVAQTAHSNVDNVISDGTENDKISLYQSWSRELGNIMGNVIRQSFEEYLLKLEKSDNKDDFRKNYNHIEDIISKFDLYADLLNKSANDYTSFVEKQSNNKNTPNL